MRFRRSLKFGKIRPWTAELAEFNCGVKIEPEIIHRPIFSTSCTFELMKILLNKDGEKKIKFHIFRFWYAFNMFMM